MTTSVLRGASAVVGVGNTPFGRLDGYSADDLGGWALKEALDDAGLKNSDIDGLVVNRVSSAEQLAADYGIRPNWTGQLPATGRNSGPSIQLAAMAIATGMCSTVALVYGNNGKTSGATYGGKGEGYGSAQAVTRAYGLFSPGAFYALMCQRYRHEFGLTEEQLATVAITFRENASLNENAVMREPITLDDYLASRYITEPLHLFDYCLINDGGVAMIMTSAEQARDFPKPPVYLLGMGQRHTELPDSGYPPPDFWRGNISAAGAAAFEMAGRTRSDIDVLQVYDNFSPNVLFALEGLGYADVGEAGEWIQGGRISRTGALPLNTSGGHLSESYMQGWGHNVEAVRQLRKEAGARQLDRDLVTAQYVCSAPIASSIIYSTEV